MPSLDEQISWSQCRELEDIARRAHMHDAEHALMAGNVPCASDVVRLEEEARRQGAPRDLLDRLRDMRLDAW
jgi:hypothetical protein